MSLPGAASGWLGSATGYFHTAVTWLLVGVCAGGYGMAKLDQVVPAPIPSPSPAPKTDKTQLSLGGSVTLNHIWNGPLPTPPSPPTPEPTPTPTPTPPTPTPTPTPPRPPWIPPNPPEPPTPTPNPDGVMPTPQAVPGPEIPWTPMLGASEWEQRTVDGKLQVRHGKSKWEQIK